jgi:hypothetical protein
MPSALRAAGTVVLVLAELSALIALIALQQRRRFEPRLAALVVVLGVVIVLWTNA